MVRQLDDLDEAQIGRGARAHQPVLLETLAKVVIDLVAVTVPLEDDFFAIDRSRTGPVPEPHRVLAESHGATQIPYLLLLRQQVHDGERRLGVEFGGVGAVHACPVSRELRDGDLHAQTDSEVRNAVLTGVLSSPDLALYPAHAEPTWDQDAVAFGQLIEGLVIGESLGVNPTDLDPRVVMRAGVLQRLED